MLDILITLTLVLMEMEKIQLYIMVFRMLKNKDGIQEELQY